jgi:hypothetical protein
MLSAFSRKTKRRKSLAELSWPLSPHTNFAFSFNFLKKKESF